MKTRENLKKKNYPNEARLVRTSLPCQHEHASATSALPHHRPRQQQRSVPCHAMCQARCCIALSHQQNNA
jgi:hypothetical protein